MKYIGKYIKNAKYLHNSDSFFLVYNDHCLYLCKYLIDVNDELLYYVAYERLSDTKVVKPLQIKSHFYSDGKVTACLDDDSVWELTDSEVIRHIYSEIC